MCSRNEMVSPTPHNFANPFVVNGLGFKQGSVGGVVDQKLDAQLWGNINRTIGISNYPTTNLYHRQIFNLKGYPGNLDPYPDGTPQTHTACRYPYTSHYDPYPYPQLPKYFVKCQKCGSVCKRNKLCQVCKLQEMQNSNKNLYWILILVFAVGFFYFKEFSNLNL